MLAITLTQAYCSKASIFILQKKLKFLYPEHQRGSFEIIVSGILATLFSERYCYAVFKFDLTWLLHINLKKKKYKKITFIKIHFVGL